MRFRRPSISSSTSWCDEASDFEVCWHRIVVYIHAAMYFLVLTGVLLLGIITISSSSTAIDGFLSSSPVMVLDREPRTLEIDVKELLKREADWAADIFIRDFN